MYRIAREMVSLLQSYIGSGSADMVPWSFVVVVRVCPDNLPWLLVRFSLIKDQVRFALVLQTAAGTPPTVTHLGLVMIAIGMVFVHHQQFTPAYYSWNKTTIAKYKQRLKNLSIRRRQIHQIDNILGQFLHFLHVRIKVTFEYILKKRSKYA